MNIPALKRIVKDRIEAVETLIRVYEKKVDDLKKKRQILENSLRYLEEQEIRTKGREER